MLRIFILFLILIAGIIAGPMLAGHQGYVLIQTDDYNLKTSVTVLVLSAIAVFAVLSLLISLVNKILNAGSWTRGWFFGLKFSRARKQTKAALLKLAEGDYQQAAKLFSRSADAAEQPVVNYLLAAESAQKCNDTFKANEYLEAATDLAGENQFPVDITRTRIQLAQKEYHAARHSVDRLLNQQPRHPEVLRLAEQTFLKTHAYQALLEILPSMYKVNLYNESVLDKLQQDAYIGLMQQTLDNNGNDGLKSWWKQQPRKVRNDSVLELAIAKLFIESDDHQTAQQIIIDGIKKAFDPHLIELIPQLKLIQPEPLEKLLRQQLRSQGDLPILNSVLGQLLIREAKWEDAKATLIKALEQRPNAKDYALLADIYDRLNQPQEAINMRQRGLATSLIEK